MELVAMKGFCNGVAAVFGAGVALIGIFVFGYQIVFWFLHGYWSPLRLGLAWERLGGREPHAAWPSFDSMMSSILDLPIAGILFFLGIVIYMIAIPNVERTVRL
jgi:hypothetical protein